MKRLLRIVTSEASSVSDRAFAKLAGFVGLECEIVEVDDYLQNTTSSSCGGVVVSFVTLQQMCSRPSASELGGFDHLLAVNHLIYGFSETADLSLLGVLTEGALTSVGAVPAGKRTYEFANALRTDGIPLAGLCTTVVETRSLSVFSKASMDAEASNLISIVDRPLLTRMSGRLSRRFLLSDSAVVDIDQRCESKEHFSVLQSAFLPAVIFLRLAFPGACWMDYSPSANIIIDDPLLRPRHGFVEYRQLMAEAMAHRYAVTLAFIPFNYDRSDRRTVEFLRTQGERFALAVHGCDHTDQEFAAVDPDVLSFKASNALSRMESHQQLTGMRCAPLMVFPQGCFSANAFAALKQTGYWAAVNTELVPVEQRSKPTLTVRDLIEGASMAFSSLPLFSRRYPTSVFDCATDLLWGKPVLLVEHHGYFKDGYPKLADFVNRLAKVNPALQWRGLANIVTEHAHVRRLATGRYGVKFFSPHFLLKNRTDSAAVFSLFKIESGSEQVDHVTVNGAVVPFELIHGKVQLEVSLRARQEAWVDIVYRHVANRKIHPSVRYRFSVAARRYLSDFRDNTISRNEVLLRCAVRLKNLIWRRR